MSESSSIASQVEHFLARWHDDVPTMEVCTSGSTGVPKRYQVEKARMQASARMTCQFLGLQQGDTALLCMPMQYIAGMMMVVRAETCGLRLLTAEPSSHPLATLDVAPDFVAMVPLQVWETLQNEREAKLLRQVRHLLIGGGAISPELEEKLLTFPHAVWSSYGMTETLSHIALRRLSGESRSVWYTPLPGVTVSQTADGCLVIDAPRVASERLVTNDIVELRDDGCFRVLGRLDNVICTGGIKVQIEDVERFLHTHYGDCLQVTSRPHPKFGEEVVYLSTIDLDMAQLRAIIPNRYWLPKCIVKLDALPRTGTGKPDRAKAKALAKDNQGISKR